MTTIRVRRGTASQWSTANPTLALGELGLETDTSKLKGGDGVTVWNSLDYISSAGGGGGGGNSWGSITGTISSQTDLQAALNAKQDDLVSGTNIKTINGASIIGSGDLVVSGGDGLKIYIQDAEPSWGASEKALWIDTTGSDLNFWVQDGT